MQNLKFGVLVCGLIGLIGCFLPMVSFGEMSVSLWKAREADAANTFIVLGGFAAALVMGALGAAKGMQRWMSGVAIAGFGIIVVKMRGDVIDMLKMEIGAKLIAIGALAGLVFAIITIVKPEPAK